MRSRLLALVALIAVASVPAFAAALESAPPASASDVVLVKAYGKVVAVHDADGQATLELAVDEAKEWRDDSDDKQPAAGIAGKSITAGLTEETKVHRGDAPAGLDALAPGTRVEALMSTDGSPVTPTCTFTLHDVWIATEKPAAKPDKPGHGFEFGFFPRNWHVRGDILGLDRVEGRNVMNLDVRRLNHAPKRFRDEGRRLASMDAYVIVPPRVVITDAGGGRIDFADLDVDDRVLVIGKFTRPAKWVKDDDGEATPTLVAKRVKVVRSR